MYKIGTISQKIIFLPLVAYGIIFVETKSQNFYPHFFQKGLFKRVKGVHVLSTRYFSRNVKNFHQKIFFYDNTTKIEEPNPIPDLVLKFLKRHSKPT